MRSRQKSQKQEQVKQDTAGHGAAAALVAGTGEWSVLTVGTLMMAGRKGYERRGQDTPEHYRTVSVHVVSV